MSRTAAELDSEEGGVKEAAQRSGGLMASTARVAGENRSGELAGRLAPLWIARYLEASPPAGGERLRNFSDIPRPFVLDPLEDDRARFSPDDVLFFGLNLIGGAARHISHACGEQGARAFRNRTGPCSPPSPIGGPSEQRFRVSRAAGDPR